LKNKLVSAFDRLEDIILVTMFSGMVAVIFYQVIMRYVFSNSSSWSEELGKFLFVWISWLGISIGARRMEHIKISLVVDKMPFKAARLTNLLTELIVIIISGITAWYAYTLVISQYSVPFAAIKISMSFGYLAVLVGCFLMCIRSIYAAYLALRGLIDGPRQIEAAEGGED
jgi:TRAP-type C4-dicarboxylate transport system permease small subunit